MTIKGFYIARYEAGKDGTTLVSKKGATVWNNINYTDSKTKAQAMYTSTNVKSGLPTGKMWDTTMQWISSVKSVTDSRTWGNHYDSISPANVSGFGVLQVTGYSNNWQAKNIYDLAGNVWEWTNEKNSSYFIYRGGASYSGVASIPVAYRLSNVATVSSLNVSFRPALYIL